MKKVEVKNLVTLSITGVKYNAEYNTVYIPLGLNRCYITYIQNTCIPIIYGIWFSYMNNLSGKNRNIGKFFGLVTMNIFSIVKIKQKLVSKMKENLSFMS